MRGVPWEYEYAPARDATEFEEASINYRTDRLGTPAPIHTNPLLQLVAQLADQLSKPINMDHCLARRQRHRVSAGGCPRGASDRLRSHRQKFLTFLTLRTANRLGEECEDSQLACTLAVCTALAITVRPSRGAVGPMESGVCWAEHCDDPTPPRQRRGVHRHRCPIEGHLERNGRQFGELTMCPRRCASRRLKPAEDRDEVAVAGPNATATTPPLSPPMRMHHACRIAISRSRRGLIVLTTARSCGLMRRWAHET